ncbi:MAG: cytochrome c oxidase assembly protein [Pseudomonadales bacterium]|nr:cytochrome c oxidase assembly protein [Pseudomonadales bacterium]
MKSQNTQAGVPIRRTVAKLCLIVVGMSAFGFALVPLYDLLCDITGLGGRTGGAYAFDAAETRIDRNRLVKVNFITNANGGMPWEFWSEKGGVRVHPGELNEAMFYVKNTTSRRMVGQAVPSLVPLSATDYFHKTECFCFNSQVLEPGEVMEMPMRFVVDASLPKSVQSISLSYALFDVTELSGQAALPGSGNNGD